jgi:hypothetical protein
MAASNAQPFEVNDFSLGVTDHVFEQKPGTAAELINFTIGHDKKPISRPGSDVDNLSFAEIPTGERVGALFNYANNDKLFYQSERSLFFRNPGVFNEIVGPSGNSVFSAGDLSAVPSFAQWNRQVYVSNDSFAIPMKVYKDQAGAYQVRNAGMPELASEPVVTAGAAGDQSFIYGFYWSYTYTVFNLTYEMIGPVTFVQLENSADPVTGPIQISGIPVITNGAENNYDTANLKLKIFRTNNGGTFLQQAGEVTNGTTTFVDSMTDGTLQNTGIDLYTNDGTVDYDPPPLHKFNHVTSNTGYYAYLKDADGNISPYKVRQSIPGIPDTAPLDFEIEVDDEIQGISSVRSMPIIACKKYIFRIDGAFDQFGRGNATPIRISDHAGCIAHNSLVQAENGLFWFGNDGIYYSDGYVVQKVSGDSDDRYQSMLQNTTQENRIVGRYFEKERLVIWAVQTNSANRDNDTFFLLDLKWGISDSMTMTTWNGVSFRPSALEVFDKAIFRGDPRGFTMRHDYRLSSDKKINQYKVASEWVLETIIWKLKTIHYNFGGTFFRKYPTRILLTAADIGNTTIQITAINDDGKVTRQCKPIRVRKDFIWRDDDFIWRVSDFIWRNAGLIEQWRRFPAGGLRLSTLQLEITNGFSDIQNSDTLGLATFDDTLKTVTLDEAESKWPLNSEDYFIATEADNYTKEFLITERDSDGVLVINDPLNQMPSGDLKWVIRGFKKDEKIHLLGFNIHWTNVSATQQTYSSDPASTGENA